MEEVQLTMRTGLLISFGMICVMKYIAYKKRSNTKPFNIWFWVANNWMEYPVILFLTWVFFVFDHDVFNVVNYTLQKLGSKWELIHFEDHNFWFVIAPVVLTLLSYRFLRKKTDKAQASLAPHVHNEFCGHDID